MLLPDKKQSVILILINRNIFSGSNSRNMNEITRLSSVPAASPAALSRTYMRYLLLIKVCLLTGSVTESLAQPDVLSEFIVVTDIIPSITVARTIRTYGEARKARPVPTATNSTSIIRSNDFII